MEVVETQASASEALYKSLHAIAHSKVSVAQLRMQVTAVLENIENGAYLPPRRRLRHRALRISRAKTSDVGRRWLANKSEHDKSSLWR
jgi:hypothetical protein